MDRQTSVALVVNGIQRHLDVPPERRLLEALRHDLGLVGAKEGCDDGTCGTCVVLVDRRAVRAYRRSVAKLAGKDVLTIEGLERAGHPHPLQDRCQSASARSGSPAFITSEVTRKITMPPMGATGRSSTTPSASPNSPMFFALGG